MKLKNSFAYITEESQIPALIESFFKETDQTGEKDGEEREIERYEKLLISSLVLYLYHTMPPERQTFETVAELVSMMEGSEPGSGSPTSVDIMMQFLAQEDPQNKAVRWYAMFVKSVAGYYYPVIASLSLRLAPFSFKEKQPLKFSQKRRLFLERLKKAEYKKNHPETAEVPKKHFVPGVQPEMGSYVPLVIDGKEVSNPGEILSFMNRYIYKQEGAKKLASILLWNRCTQWNAKENALFIGPSGCGKTEIFRTLGMLYSPVFIYDISDLSSDGWVGRKKTFSVFESMLAMGHTKEAIERSIIVFDEADKIFSPRYSSGGDNVNEEIQGEMLSMIEGTDIQAKLPGEGKREVTINTRNIIFVMLGAFEGLYKERDRNRKKKTGFAIKEDTEKKTENPALAMLYSDEDQVSVEELQKYGMRTELAGRITSIAMLDEMTEEDYYRIMTSDMEMNPIRKATQRYHRPPSLSEEQLRYIAKEAARTKTGVRYIHAAIQRVMNESLFRYSRLENGELIYEEEPQQNAGGSVTDESADDSRQH